MVTEVFASVLRSLIENRGTVQQLHPRVVELVRDHPDGAVGADAKKCSWCEQHFSAPVCWVRSSEPFFMTMGIRFTVPASPGDPGGRTGHGGRRPAIRQSLLSALRGPGTHTGDPIHPDVGDVPGRWVFHRRKADFLRSHGHCARWRAAYHEM